MVTILRRARAWNLFCTRWDLNQSFWRIFPRTVTRLFIEKLERYLGEHGDVGFACVLLTPDDEGHEAGKPVQKKYRARQNVILELGMVLARLGRRRVLIL